MLHWRDLTTEQQLNEIRELSHTVPCFIFKHSTRCSTSVMVKNRVEREWNATADELPSFYLDLLRYRPVSNLITEQFGIHHESPQAIVIVNGEAIYDASHISISARDIQNAASQPA